MSSPPSSPPQPREQSPSTMPPSGSQDMSPAELSTPHSNKVSPMPTPPADRTPLSPADCRTLQKILEDVQNPSPTASTSQSKEDESLIIAELAGEDFSDTDSGYRVTYTEVQHEYGDEASDGYEDEDRSMGLSDGIGEEGNEAAELAEGQLRDVDSAEEVTYVWSDGDTIEDMMNLPGKVAAPARQQDLAGILAHEHSASEESKQINQQRDAIEEALEEALEAEYLEHEGQELRAGESGTNVATATHEDDALNLSDDPEIRAVEAMQAETGMNVGTNEMGGIELEYIEPSTRRMTQLFSPKSASHRMLAASEHPILAPDFSGPRPAVIQTPSGKHLEFTSSAAIPDTPFSKTLSYYKRHKGKENSPSKNRRNASLPEEIAELAREANEEEDLEKYREIDLAPMEPVMEGDSIGDLITFDPPVRSSIFAAGTTSTLLGLSDECVDDTEEDSNDEMSDLVRDAHAGTVVDLVDPPLPSQDVARSLSSSKHDSDSDADAENSKLTPEEEDGQLVLAPEPPTWMKVIELLPEVIIGQVAAGLAHYSNSAYERLVDKLHGLGL